MCTLACRMAHGTAPNARQLAARGAKPISHSFARVTYHLFWRHDAELHPLHAAQLAGAVLELVMHAGRHAGRREVALPPARARRGCAALRSPPPLPPGGCRARAGRRRAGERCRLRSPPPPLSVARDLAGAAQRARRVAHQPRALIWSPYIHGGSGAATPRGLPRRAPRSVVSLVCVRVCECRGARSSHGAAAARARAAAGARAARGSCRRLPACRCVRSAGQAAGGARGRPSRAVRAARAGRPCSCWAWPESAIR